MLVRICGSMSFLHQYHQLDHPGQVSGFASPLPSTLVSSMRKCVGEEEVVGWATKATINSKAVDARRKKALDFLCLTGLASCSPPSLSNSTLGIAPYSGKFWFMLFFSRFAQSMTTSTSKFLLRPGIRTGINLFQCVTLLRQLKTSHFWREESNKNF